MKENIPHAGRGKPLVEDDDMSQYQQRNAQEEEM
jgi:hypothetical protein